MIAWDIGTAYQVLEWAIRLGGLIVIPFKRKATATAWLLFLFLLPVPGLLLFLAIGQPRFPRWRTQRFEKLRPFFESVSRDLAAASAGGLGASADTAALAQRLGGLPPVGGNAIELLDDYDGLIGRLIEDIDAARSYVRLLIYIFADDSVGQAVISALGRAVRRGVVCEVLLDPVGSRPWIRGTIESLRREGVSTRQALPFHWLRGRTRRDMRNHRKLFVIDGFIGYAGSQNIVAKDFRRGVVNHELVARVTGPIVAALEAVILMDWCLETNRTPPPSLPVPARSGSAALQLLPSGADYPLEGFQTLLVWQLHEARQRVIIVSPYFIPDQDVVAALQTAAARGLEVDIVVSKVVDYRLVNLAQRSYYDELLACGVRIHEFRDHLLHAKNVSIDGNLGIVGSSNVDLRSFQLNEEVSLLLLDRASVASLENIQRNYLKHSDRIDLDQWRRRGRPAMLAENLAHITAPLL
jgi:cardiolipin synthase A/B